MITEDDAVSAADDPRGKEGSEIATAPAASTGTAAPEDDAPGNKLAVQLPGDTIAEKIDALHTKHFVGTKLANDTGLWNAVHAFKEDVKRLLGEQPAA